MHRIFGVIDRKDSERAGTDWSAILAPARPATLSGGPAALAALAARTAATPADALYADDGLTLVATARLDDLCELRSQLGEDETASPARLIAAAWRRWGIECPVHLHGDYAFALHDDRSGESFCARDHVGARPFFYALDAGRLAFATDPASLLAVPGVPDDLDEDYIASTLVQHKYLPPDRSFVRAVRRLPAGHRLHCRGGRTTIDRWWHPERIAIHHDADDQATLAAFRALLDRVVADRLDGAARFALHLSGGIDSSVVAALAVPRLRARGHADPVAYCWHEIRPGDPSDSEAGWSESIRAALGLELRAPTLSTEEMTALFAQDWTRGPDIRNLLHEAAIQRDAGAAGVEVILSGWGGDEGASFNGRGHHPRLFATGRWLQLYSDRTQPGRVAGLRTIYRAGRRLARELRPHPPVRWRRPARPHLADPALLRRSRLSSTPRIREFGVRATQFSLLQNSSTTPRLEDWAISGAVHGIEYRYPLLDRRLLEFVYSLPPRMFRRAGTRRWLIRTATEGLIPDVVRLNGRKTEPLRCEWIDRALADTLARIEQLLEARTAPPARARYLDMPRLRARLAKAVAAGTGRDQPLRHALQFLDFE